LYPARLPALSILSAQADKGIEDDTIFGMEVVETPGDPAVSQPDPASPAVSDGTPVSDGTAVSGPDPDDTPVVEPPPLSMREAWDERARQNAEFFVANATEVWDLREFFRSGEISVANEVMPDMHDICGGSRSPLDLNILEIGCGVGRMTKMLARIFGKVTAVDVSAEMIEKAKVNLRGLGNVSLVLGDGETLSELGDSEYDFAFSFIVFQHIPSMEVIASYCREVERVLKPGSLFKFQVQGGLWEREAPPDSWYGVTVTEEDAERLCTETGFTLERTAGAGSQYFWLWFRKPRPLPEVPPAEAVEPTEVPASEPAAGLPEAPPSEAVAKPSEVSASEAVDESRE
jgi:ubiquinone/menaquinone biosynthesis C-methylase UbiE